MSTTNDDNKCAKEDCKGFTNGATLCPMHEREVMIRAVIAEILKKCEPKQKGKK